MENKIKITFISDTHNKHKQADSLLTNGDILIHSGDMTSMGYTEEIINFCIWFNKLDNYKNKLFISGNHDFIFEKEPIKAKEIYSLFDNIKYLQDECIYIENEKLNRPIKIYGSPWQPLFYNWAFNLTEEELAKKWEKIPEDVDILITHGPAYGYLDRVIGKYENLGSKTLIEAIKLKKPKIHVCGHIHSGHGYYFDGNTHFINASLLNESYNLVYKPITIDWFVEKNEISFD